MVNDVQHLFMCLFVKCLFRSFAHFLIRFFFSVGFWEYFVYSTYKSFIRYVLFFFNLLVSSLSFHLLHRVKEPKFLIFITSNLSKFPLMDHSFSVKSKNTLPSSESWRFSLFFPCFVFKTMIHFGLILYKVWDVKFGLVWLLPIDVQLLQYHLLKRISFLH